MPTSAEWGWSWAVAAHAVTWIVLVAYARYASRRSHAAHEALVRETRRAGEAG